jgi:hypothetical protein
MENDCPRTIVHPLTRLSFRGQLSMKLNIFHFSSTILKFRGRSRNFRKFQLFQILIAFQIFMDNVVHETTTLSMGGQLSVDNRCLLTIFHVCYKTLNLFVQDFFIIQILTNLKVDQIPSRLHNHR